MDKTIEKEFFKAFEFGGVVHGCIEVIKHKYDLGYLPNSDKLPDKWEKYYNETLPDIISQETEAFDDTVITMYKSSLIEEIGDNLESCNNDIQRNRYLYTLLEPFRELSDIYYSTSQIDNIKDFMQEGEDNSEELKTIERLEYVRGQFREIVNCKHPKDSSKQGTVERCFCAFLSIANRYANRLDALLLTFGIDLLQSQKECGIYLKDRRCITDVEFYLGSVERAEKLIADLPKPTPEPQPEPQALPRELDNPEAGEIFAIAIEVGLMEQSGEGYKWKGSDRECVYFARCFNVKIWGKPDVVPNSRRRYKSEQISWRPFEEMFSKANFAQEWVKIDREECDYPNVDKVFN